MIDFVAAVERESRRFGDVVTELDFGGRVPSCPDWSVADLVWHLGEVQWFWWMIVNDLRADPEFPPLERPADDGLLGFYEDSSAKLVEALARQPEDAPCWSWHPNGHDVGWVRRRQAHEALIHRADAELAAGIVPVLDQELADDGIDEMIDIMLDGYAEWGTYERKGQTIDLETPGKLAAVELGWFSGTSPEGTSYAQDGFCRAEPGTASAIVRAPDAPTMDLWMWRRLSDDHVEINGDRALVERLRADSDIQ